MLNTDFGNEFKLAYLFIHFLFKWKFMYHPTFSFLEQIASLLCYYQVMTPELHSPIVAITNPMAYYLLKDKSVVGILLFLFWSFFGPEYQQVIISVCEVYEKWTSHPVNCELWDLTSHDNEGREGLSILSIIKEKPHHEYVVWAPKTLQKLLCAILVQKCLPSKVNSLLPATRTTVSVSSYPPHVWDDEDSDNDSHLSLQFL
jgi:hypothetical protein